MAIHVYLNFDGNTKEAVLYYAEVFKSEEPQMMTFGSMPQNPEHPMPEAALERIMHANLKVYDSNIMFSDTFPGMNYVQGNHMSIMLGLSDMEELKRVFGKLGEGGYVQMPLQETFWSKCYGQVQDKYGIIWQLNFE